nr:vacuolar-sorting receptor 4 [Quercus suber]
MGSFVGLEVISPDSLKGVYEYANEDFRTLQYGGGSMVGTVVYPKANQKACRNFEDGVFFKSKPGGQRIFLLVDRGDCYFALKAWNAQNGGTAAILIADDRIEPLNTLGSDEEDDPDSEYVHDILIPSALISKSFGDTIKKAISCTERQLKWALIELRLFHILIIVLRMSFGQIAMANMGQSLWLRNCLKVNSQRSLGGAECAIVGVPHYRGTMFGTVVYPEANQKACNSFADLDIFFKSRPGRLPVFLADRGVFIYDFDVLPVCYFTLKAWNAQNGGAAAILVADNKVEPLITMDTPEEYDEYVENITIPSNPYKQIFGG